MSVLREAGTGRIVEVQSGSLIVRQPYPVHCPDLLSVRLVRDGVAGDVVARCRVGGSKPWRTTSKERVPMRDIHAALRAWAEATA